MIFGGNGVHGHFFLNAKNSIQARLSMIFVTVMRKTCLVMILCPGPLKYFFYYLINLDFGLGVRHYPVLPYASRRARLLNALRAPLRRQK